MPIQAVIEKLNVLGGLHRTLYELAERKKTVLINNQVNELAALVNQESKMMKQVAEADVVWREAIVHFVQSNGVKPSPSMTVSDILKLVFNAEDRKALQDAQQELLRTIHQLKEINALNQQMIEQSLSFIDYSIDLFMGDTGQSATYNNPAQTSGSWGARQGLGLYDKRA
jgi:flagellar biosynthesis/type III secretory pathway chaperone